MKKIVILISLAFLIIIGAMVSLVKKGVSLRANTLITPSKISKNDSNVGPAIAQRLFPDFQASEILIIGLPAGNSRLQIVAEQIAASASQLLGAPIHRVDDKLNPQDCKKLCWIVVQPEEAQELEQNKYIESVIKPLGRSYFTLNLIEFRRLEKNQSELEISQCEKEKLLDFKCLSLLSIKDAERKMKMADQLYFFMKKYQDRGHYLFLQTF